MDRFKHSFTCWRVAGILGLLLTAGCTPRRFGGSSQTSNSVATSQSSNELFRDVSAQAKLDFTLQLGDTSKFYFSDTTPAGCTFFDYDNDGYLDVFLVQSGSSSSSAAKRPLCALYHNQHDGTFKEVTVGSGLDKDLGYAQGVAVGDYDNDGFDDLFITSYGGNHLFRNVKGSGHFQDVTQAQHLDKVHGAGYATSAAWGDYDNDGKLDLYVCYYVRWTPALDRNCTDAQSGERDYCRPQIYLPDTHQLFHNTGHGFEDVSQKSGISKSQGRGLAVAFTDYNGDGKQDIFVANDVTPNMLWKNNGNGTFTNRANEAGCAYDGEGQDMSGMGIGIADYNRSGLPSLYVTNFSSRPNVLFENVGQGFFQDATRTAQLALTHLRFLSFGCEFLDYDADGWPDLIVNNGHVQVVQKHFTEGTTLKQRKQLLHNEGNGQFREITDEKQLGDLNLPVVGRGLATGDFDNDGRVDVLAMAQNAPVQLLRNQTGGNGNHFVSLLLRGTHCNADAVGARVELTAGNTKQVQWVRGGSSYLSSSDRRLFFGLGKNSVINRVSVIWPDGKKENLPQLRADAFYTITQGKSVVAKSLAGAELATRESPRR